MKTRGYPLFFGRESDLLTQKTLVLIDYLIDDPGISGVKKFF